MNDCGWLSDRMPAVALGKGEWTPEEIRHLSECRMCQDEWELVHAASRLGEGIGSVVDPTLTADAVLRRLARERREAGPRRRAWTFAGLAAAATIAVAVWTGGPTTQHALQPPVGSVVANRLSIPLPELEGLQPAELDTVLQTMDEPADGSTLDAPGPGDPQNDELDLVLDSWEA